jgi:hypothetical protein
MLLMVLIQSRSTPLRFSRHGGRRVAFRVVARRADVLIAARLPGIPLGCALAGTQRNLDGWPRHDIVVHRCRPDTRMARNTARNGNDGAANLGFEAKLWLAADKLRNNLDAAEYKHVEARPDLPEVHLRLV